MNAAFVRIFAGKTDLGAFAIGFGIKAFDRLKRNTFKSIFFVPELFRKPYGGFLLPSVAFLRLLL